MSKAPYAQTDELTRRALKVDARASTRGDILPTSRPGEQTIFPRYVTHAKGAHVWDADGNRYLDYLLGYGAIVLGHADDRVNAAVVRSLEAGSCFSPFWSPLQVELTEMLVSIIPGAEQAYLLKTGSDATSAAVRLSRIFTGRNRVARWGYNGWHDWSAPFPAGVPSATRSQTLLFEYNEIGSLRKILEEHRNEFACVVMMPFELEPPLPGFLEQVREVAHEHGALFVLDEMRSGFRMALGGAQEYYNVTADIGAFSKAMSNGYPISAIVGRADVLSCLRDTKISSTFYASAPEMSASLATISILRETDAFTHLWSMGGCLQEGLRALISEYEVPAQVVGLPLCPFMRFLVEDTVRRATLEECFYGETARRGVLLHPNHHWYVSASHAEEDIDDTLKVCRHAFKEVVSCR